MIKPDSLQSALVAVMPVLGRERDRLAIFVDQGQIVAQLRDAPRFPSPAFEYRYRLNVLLRDLHANATDAVSLALVLWLHEHQPELLLRPGDPAFKFEANIIDARTIDLAIELQLSETVRVKNAQDGLWELEHVAEPPAIDELPGVPRFTPLRRLDVGGVTVLGHPD